MTLRLGCTAAAIAIGMVAAPVKGQEATASLAALIAQVRDADYRGDLTALEALVTRMEPYVTDASLAGSARYWRGFALWRRALNAANDTAADALAIERDFRMSASEFEEALALDSSDVESRIGFLSGLMNAAHFRYRRDAAEASRLMSRAMHEAERLLASAADNPRFVFVWAARLYWAPPDQGGDRAAAIRLIEQTIERTPASEATHDALKPNWGVAELHMQAAFFLSNLRPPELSRAEDHARTALEMHPQWSYVKDNLLPSIVERRKGGAASQDGIAVWVDPAWQSATVQAGQVRRASIWFERQYVDRAHDYVSRAAEHDAALRSVVRRAVMDTLRAIHERSWTIAARAIEELERAGVVANCSRHWIVNSVACDVPGGDPSKLAAIPGASRIFLNGFGRGLAAPAAVTDPRTRPDPDGPYRPDPAKAPWYAQFLGVDRVWSEYGLTGRGVLHVVHDFGWTLGPPTIRSTLWRNAGEVADNGRDDEGNGYVDDIHGYNFDRGNGDLTAPNAGGTPGGATHGDLTAALMAGRELVDTALVVGIAPDSRWAAVVNRSGIEASIEWALLVGADTYSMSFSIPNLGELRSHWRKVLEHASLAGLFLASGAGNFADSTRPGYVPVPVQMRIPEDIPYAVFGVSGVGRDGRRPSFASQGPVLWQTAEYDEGQVMKPDFATVNTNLLLFDGEGRKFMPSERGWSGNSFAGPITAGIIALMLEADPELTPWRARDILVRTARDVEPAGVDAQTGAGVIDAWAAVTEVMRERREREAARGS